MRSEWARARLGDLVSIKHGWPFKSELYSLERHGRPIVVSIGNFQYTGGFRFDSTSIKEYAGEYPRDYELRPGDILLVMTCQTSGGEILGIPARIPDDGSTYLHNQRLGLVVPRDPRVDLGFLYWLFLSRSFNQHLVSSASGTKILHTAPSRIESFELDLPPLAEQRAIARIIGALDEKIELNRKMNATLEAMARALFKSWFVDFDPVRAKSEGRPPTGMDAETAKLFPSEMVESELGPIPRGWTAGTLGDLIELLDSRRVPLSAREREQRRGPFPYYGATSVMDYVDDFLFDGRFVLVGEDGSVATPDGFPFTQYVWGRFWVNNHAHVAIGTRGVSQEHLYLLMQQTNIAAFVTGAVQAKLSQGNMRRIPLPVAPEVINEQFGAMVEPLFARYRALSDESKIFARLRDELLPRLLSGELALADLVHEVEPLA